MTRHRKYMSDRERRARSRLSKIAHDMDVIRACLREVERVCGKVDCHCIRQPKHPMAYLSQSKNGRAKSIYISQDKKELSKEWIKNYKEAKELLETISDECIKKIKGKSKNKH